jgi:SNF family Na+-dependent transporter
MAIFVGWVWRIPKFAKEAGIKSEKAFGIWTFLIKYLAPIIIIITWLAQLGIINKIRNLLE